MIALTGSADEVLRWFDEQHQLKKHGDVILIPQPSGDPNDPLNWSRAWKNTITAVLGFFIAATISLGPMIIPGLPILAYQYQLTMNQVSSVMLGSFQLAVGLGMILMAAIATIRARPG